MSTSSANRPPSTLPLAEELIESKALGGKFWLGAGLIGMLVMYFFGMYEAYPSSAGKTLADWTWRACNAKNDFLHGRAIPVIFLVMCYVSWKQARLEVVAPTNWGLAVVGFGIALFALSIRTKQPRYALFGLPFLVLGGVLYLFGPKVAKHYLFPAFIWYFAIPIPGIQQATALLQVSVTKLCFQAGLLMGMPIVNDGNTIASVGPTKWDFDIAEGCSGIRSLMALAMIAAIYANYTQKTLWKKLVLFACALPLSLLGNFGRIFTILVLAHYGFSEFAAKTYHDWAGLLIFFPIALSGLFVADHLLNLRGRGKRKLVRRTQRAEAAKGERIEIDRS